MHYYRSRDCALHSWAAPRSRWKGPMSGRCGAAGKGRPAKSYCHRTGAPAPNSGEPGLGIAAVISSMDRER